MSLKGFVRVESTCLIPPPLQFKLTLTQERTKSVVHCHSRHVLRMSYIVETAVVPSPHQWTSHLSRNSNFSNSLRRVLMYLQIQSIISGLGFITQSHLIMYHLAMHSRMFLLLLSCQWSHFVCHNQLTALLPLLFRPRPK